MSGRGWAPLLLVLVALSFISTHSDPNDQQAFLKLGSLGTLRGIYRGSHSIFQGIPYAQAPVGKLRFAPPKPWSTDLGERSAWRDGVVCPQTPVTYGDGGVVRVESEDCLQLDIWLPKEHLEWQGGIMKAALLPIMVWLGHGDWDGDKSSLGAAATAAMHRTSSTGKGVSSSNQIWVSCNWRRGALGFMAHPDISAEYPHAPANFGLLDQRLCLEWIQEHAAHIGGDPKSVTVYGQGAAACSIVWQLAGEIETGKKLFQKGIVQSPSTLGVQAKSKEDAEEQGQMFAAAHQCNSLRCLRELPWQVISTTPAVRSLLLHTESKNAWAPSIDGVQFRAHPIKRLLEDESPMSTTTLVLGHNSFDGASLIQPPAGSTNLHYGAFPMRAPSRADAKLLIRKMLPAEEASWVRDMESPECLMGLADGEAVTQAYEGHCVALKEFYLKNQMEKHVERISYVLSKYRGRETALWDDITKGHLNLKTSSRPEEVTSGARFLATILHDMYFVCPVQRLARGLRAKGQAVHMYLMNVSSSPGVPSHGAELPYLFRSEGKQGLLKYWSKVASGEDLTHGSESCSSWSRFDTQKESTIIFTENEKGGVDGKMGSSRDYGSLCEIWDKVFPAEIPLIESSVLSDEPWLLWFTNTYGLLFYQTWIARPLTVTAFFLLTFVSMMMAITLCQRHGPVGKLVKKVWDKRMLNSGKSSRMKAK